MSEFASARDGRSDVRAEDAKLREILETAAVPMHFVGADGIVIWANQAELQLLGYSRDEYLGRHIGDFHVDAPVVEAMLARLSRGETLRDHPARLRRRDGAIRDVLVSSSVLFTAGKFVHTRCFTRDVTEQRRAEVARIRSEALLIEHKNLLEIIASGSPLSESLDALCESVSRLEPGVRACVLLADAERAAHVRIFAPALASESDEGPANSDRCVGAFGEAMPSGKPVTSTDIANDPRWPEEWCNLCATRGVRACHSTPIVDGSGVVQGALVLCFEESRTPSPEEFRLADFGARLAAAAIDRDRANRSMREKEERFEDALDAGDLGAWELDLGTRRVWRSAQHDRIFGYATLLAEWTYELLLEHIVPEDRASVERKFTVALAQSRDWRFECRIRRADGAIRWIWVSGKISGDEAGRPVRMKGIVRDITERKAAEDALAAELLRTRELQKTSTLLLREDRIDAIYRQILDAATTVMDSDMASLQMLDREAGELRLLESKGFHPDSAAFWSRVRADSGSSCGAALARGERIVVEDIDRSALIVGTPDHDEYRRSQIRAVQSTPLVSRSGSVLGMISTHWRETHRPPERDLQLLDVLARQAADLIERWQGEQARREADARKDEFLALLAHELRNPLAPLRNGVAIMKRVSGGGEAAQHAAAIMDRQLDHMVRIVDDLLDVSRISRGKLELRREPIDVASAIRDAIELCRPALDAGRYAFDVVLPDEPVHVDGDRVRLAQVFGNLLGNACKYTDAGGHVALSARREADDIVVSVRDDGIGIAPDMLSRVFDIFAQLKQPDARSEGGLGIGLTLVRRIVEMHGGSVEAHSAGTGRGSEFVVRLPIAPGAEASDDSADTQAEDETRTGWRVLVADDNRDAATSLASWLSMDGNETRTAHDGIEAVEVAEQFQPQIVLLDIGMPRLNGYDACRRIRAAPWSKDVTLVALTGWGQDDAQRKSREAGFDAHITKPIELAKLTHLLAELRGRAPGSPH